MRRGFTLLELIITLAIVAVLSTFLIQFLGTSLTRSGDPMIKAKTSIDLLTIAEKISTDYKRLMADSSLSNATALATLKARIEAGNVPTATPYYGNYTYTTKYIAFDPTTRVEKPAAEGDTILKVKISSGGHSLTLLYTR